MRERNIERKREKKQEQVNEREREAIRDRRTNVRIRNDVNKIKKHFDQNELPEFE